MCPNSKKIKGGSLIIIIVRVSGKFGGWVDTDTREVYNQNSKRRRRKYIIFSQVNHPKYLAFGGVLWYNEKNSCHNINTLKFEE